jgi:hypothetical protein
VHEIATVKNRDARKVREAARNEIEVSADTADTRVGVKPGKDGVSIRGGHAFERSLDGPIDVAIP